MSIALPTTPNARKFHIDVQDWGGLLTPGLGGAVQRINRIGMRYALKVELPPLLSRTNGRIWSNRLTLALQSGALYNVPSDGLVISSPGTPLIFSNVTGGITVPIKGLIPGYAFREGQWLSFVTGGRRYLHASAFDVSADGAGRCDLTLTTPLRVPLAVNDVVEIAIPKIEGFLTDPVGWDTMLEPYNQIGFTIAEAQ